jgi:hypothetical protein
MSHIEKMSKPLQRLNKHTEQKYNFILNVNKKAKTKFINIRP